MSSSASSSRQSSSSSSRPPTRSRPTRSASSTLVTISEVPSSAYEDELLYAADDERDDEDTGAKTLEYGAFENETELIDFLGWMERREYRVARPPRLPTIYEEPADQWPDENETPDMVTSDAEDTESSLPFTPPLSRRSSHPLMHGSEPETSRSDDFSKACDLLHAHEWKQRLVIPARVTSWLVRR